MAAGKAVESDFDKWQKSKGGFGDLVWLSLDGTSRTINFLLEGMDEFSITYPPNYPVDDNARFVSCLDSLFLEHHSQFFTSLIPNEIIL